MNEKDQPETQFSCDASEQAYARGRCSGFNLGEKSGYDRGFNDGVKRARSHDEACRREVDHNGPPGLSKSEGFGIGHSAVGEAIDAGIARAEMNRPPFTARDGSHVSPAVELVLSLGYQWYPDRRAWASNAPSTVELRDDAARALHQALTGGAQVASMKDIFDAYLSLTVYATDTDPTA